MKPIVTYYDNQGHIIHHEKVTLRSLNVAPDEMAHRLRTRKVLGAVRAKVLFPDVPMFADVAL